jgi:hypothetical protein
MKIKCPTCLASEELKGYKLTEGAVLVCPNCGAEFGLVATLKRLPGEGAVGEEPPVGGTDGGAAAELPPEGDELAAEPPAEEPPSDEEEDDEEEEEEEEGEDDEDDEDDEEEEKEEKESVSRPVRVLTCGKCKRNYLAVSKRPCGICKNENVAISKLKASDLAVAVVEAVAAGLPIRRAVGRLIG